MARFLTLWVSVGPILAETPILSVHLLYGSQKYSHQGLSLTANPSRWPLAGRFWRWQAIMKRTALGEQQ